MSMMKTQNKTNNTLQEDFYMTEENKNLVPCSLDPDTFVSSGFLDDVDVVFHSFSFVEFDYKGAADEPIPCLTAEMTVGNSEKRRNEYWKMGNPGKFVPVNNGKGIAATTKKGLSNASKGYLFLKSLKDAGIPAEMINGGDISVLDGLVAHVVQLAATAKIDGKEVNYQVPIVSEIISMPGEAAKAKTEKKEKEEKEADNTIVTSALNVLATIIKEAGGKIAKTDLAPAAFTAIPNDNPNKTEMLGVLFDDSKTGAIVDIKDGILTLK